MSDEIKAKEGPGQAQAGPVGPSPIQLDQPELPEALPLLPLAEMHLYPRMIYPVIIVDHRLAAVVQDTVLKERIVGLFALKEESRDKEQPDREDLEPVGTAAFILKMNTTENGTLRMMVQGVSRIKLLEMVETDPYLIGRVEALADVIEMDDETKALMTSARSLFKKVLELAPGMPAELQVMSETVDHPGLLADMIASALNIAPRDKQDVLKALNVKARLKKVIFFLQSQLDILELGSKIQSQIKGQIDKTQREYYLREQLKAIQSELGEGDETAGELEELNRRLAEKNLPEEARRAAQKELARLKRMHSSSAEYSVSRTYLDWILDLPWREATEDTIDIDRSQAILDRDHFDLEKVKKRIIEYLAVRRLKPDMKGPILCLVGPPGTGKTSLGRSIARALGRKFVRISLGGVRDEAEIRGHRRTYVGALPGRIIQGINKAGSSNPVFMLDEIDKLGADFRGDPSSALLEVLDPEQNFSFSDHYLEAAFDLSPVMFITTANVLDTIPGPLRDRMEILQLAGYTNEEKALIAKRYLIPRQREAHGLTAKDIVLRDGAVKRLIADYTREAGLRNLEREIANVCRQVAVQVARGRKQKTIIKTDDLVGLLGPAKFESEVRARTSPAGVATGLAWTQAGGDILFIEATAMPGKGQLTLTGQLGEVMKESVQAGLSLVRSRSAKLGVKDEFFAQNDIHLHVPAGAIPKDGPSAGVTMVTALASLVTGRPVRPDVAMTGEITLRGLVLPVGGIKEKVLAAKRAGIKNVILPARNANDAAEISEELKKGLKLHLVKTIDEVLKSALK